MEPARRIILIEPDMAVRKALMFSLGLEGFEVETVDPSQALDRLDEEDDDACLVIDHYPYNADALQLLTRLTGGSRRPAVVLATHPAKVLRERVSAAGAVLVEKPLLGDVLTEALRAIFDQPRAA